MAEASVLMCALIGERLGATWILSVRPGKLETCVTQATLFHGSVAEFQIECERLDVIAIC
jgi:hypothetical protein